MYFQRSHSRRGFDNLIKVIMDVLKKHACVSYVDGATKLMSFVSNNVNVFQVMRHGVIRQIQD
jgi:Holliday junction resolvase RusA-like endonuclease